MRKVSIQRGWPPATPIALNTKDVDGIGLSDLARAGIKERRDPNIGRHARSVGTVRSKWHKVACRGGASSTNSKRTSAAASDPRDLIRSL
jgi:hypothetical protein